MKYASQTTVSPDRSRAEIEAILRRYGASKFVYGWQEDAAMIGFEANGRRLRFVLPIPDESDVDTTPKGRKRRNVTKALDQSTRQRWRALALAIKAKLETVESGIATFEDEFMAYIVLPNGSTVGEWLVPQIGAAYERGQMPPMLPMLPAPR